MKVLYFFPGNPLVRSQGNHVRAYTLLQYFKAKNITLDLVAEADKHFTEQDVEALKSQKLVNQVHFLPKHKKGGLSYFLKVSIPKLFSKIPKPFDRRQLNQQQAFNKVLQANTYDKIIVSYSCWIPLVLDNPYLKGATTIVDTHDFLTSQFKSRKDFNLGKFFEGEMKLLNSVDQVWAISVEEKYLFEQFIKTPVHLVPHLTTSKIQSTTKTIDVLYVASENEHNIVAAQWFFNKVYPLLETNISITVVGKINKHIKDYPNVNKINYVEDLSATYNASKVVICPMLSGTGLKIKVVEALSFNLPVVCNTRGVDGLINKVDNGCLVTDNATKFAAYITQLINDSSFYEANKQKANLFYEEFLSEKAVYSTLDQILN
ncbi:putative glycosyltransferase [Mesoflavibacter sp. HG96]|uniref:glycosyltransferase n=1 Tax=unclassified Mesoflavibacter TaxID=2630131 RepID=UPI000D0EF2D4|nr:MULTISPECIES: glycosyltransferase [unclassified Mesoflavibacter]QIJ89653.1 putative glycosyltransferase [Mesoflavibacter sp. HG96]QIJ92381.1 putative glycosyltransferase [Mesoflavibacter sp. HG37]